MRSWLALALLAACTDAPAPPDPDRSTAAAYRGYLNRIELAARRYERAAAGATMLGCASALNTYVQDAGTSIDLMGPLAADLDALVTDNGGPADLACVAAALQAELDAHVAVACQSGAVETDRAEAMRHLLAAGPLLDAGFARIDEILAGLDAGTWTWTAPSACR